jgi:hypothetical protein
MANGRDVTVLRELARQVAENAAKLVQDERRGISSSPANRFHPGMLSEAKHLAVRRGSDSSLRSE